MRKFILNAIVKPGAGILFFIGFGTPLIFFGFQSVGLNGLKDTDGKIAFTVVRSQLFGIMKNKETITHVKRAELSKHTITNTPRPGIPLSESVLTNVAVVSPSEKLMVFIGDSEVDEVLKRKMVDEINGFINNPQDTEYTETFHIRNVFGWVGLPFAIFGLFGLITWPHTIRVACRKYLRKC